MKIQAYETNTKFLRKNNDNGPVYLKVIQKPQDIRDPNTQEPKEIHLALEYYKPVGIYTILDDFPSINKARPVGNPIVDKKLVKDYETYYENADNLPARTARVKNSETDPDITSEL